MPKYIWGIDSAQSATESLYQCVKQNLSYPYYWGRYLNTVEGSSEGLTKEEINFLKSKGIKLLPIYNDFREAIGYRQGQTSARNAIYHARRLDIPKGTPIFANVERFLKVDAEWLRAWVETVYPSGYPSGFYFDPIEGGFNNAYCQAIKDAPVVANRSILWSEKPEIGITNNKNKPSFKPNKPNCKATVLGWRYGKNASACEVNTNLISNKLFKILF